MSIASVIGLAIISLALIVVVKQYRPEIALGIAIASASVLMLAGVGMSANVIAAINSLFEKANVNGEYIALIFKALGVCYLCKIAKDICVDCGQTALADRVDFVGKISICALSLPLISQVIALITELLT